MGPLSLHIRLFGALELRLGDTLLPPLESGRAESLLAYLLLHRETPQVRQHLAFLLWPDSTESQARTNLRHVLHTLRRALPALDQYLEVTPNALRWRADLPCWLDIDAFEAATAAAAGDDGGGIDQLRAALELYRGDLLEGCYDEWLFGERERLLQRYLDALGRFVALLEARGDHSQAITYAERLLRHDLLREETYRVLMRLHAARGEPARALRVYHACVATLERELGVEPSVATRGAYEALLTAADGTVAAVRPTARTGGAALVGRAREQARLAALWQTTERGRAQLLLVTGEPGIGKTRLIEEFRSWCAHRGAATAGARAYSAEGALAYGPIVEWLRSDALNGVPERLDRPHLTELARLLPELLTQVPGLPRPEPLPEGEQRQRLYDALDRAIRVAGRPLLLVADDLQWFDRETLQFLHYLLRAAPDTPLLVAATLRREELTPHHPLHDLLVGLEVLERSTEIELGRLTLGETAILAERLTGHALTDPDAANLHAATEGNPLFVVEALRAGWPDAAGGHSGPSPKVQAVIESRLAQLSAATRDLVGIAATIGRAFTAEVLALEGDADEETLVHGLDELWRRRIIREQGADGYDFSHDLIRGVAYAALSPAGRRHHHLRVARALERVNVHDTRPVSGQLAAHYDRAGAADEAIAWYERAAEAAQQSHASNEASHLLYRALDLLGTLPVTPDRQARELAILTALPVALLMNDGFQSARLTRAQRRALDLAQALGQEPEPPLLRSLAIASLCRDEFAESQQAAERLRARGARDNDTVLLVEAHYLLGIAAFWQGEFATAVGHFRAVVAYYRPEQRRVHLLRYGQDPKVVCLHRLAYTLWFLGYPDAALRTRDEGLAMAEEIDHPHSRAMALAFAAMLCLEARERQPLSALLSQLVAAESGQSAWHTRTMIEVLEGYGEVLHGRAAIGLARIQRTIAASPAAAPAPGYRALLQRVLLEACVAAGDPRLGLATAERLLAMGKAAGLWQAEAHRARAEFLAAVGAPPGEIEAALRRALALAHSQDARSLELRSATSLLNHLRGQGDGTKTSAAHAALAALYGGFSEGHATPDLREAAALLART